MFYIYLLMITTLSIIILKKFITKRKRMAESKLSYDMPTTTYEPLSIIDTIPYYKYCNNVQTRTINIPKGTKIDNSSMFYILKGSIAIYMDDRIICRKYPTDFYFYALAYLKQDLKNLSVYAYEDLKVIEIKISTENKYVILSSIKKKVIEVLTRHFKMAQIFIELEYTKKEISNNSKMCNPSKESINTQKSNETNSEQILKKYLSEKLNIKIDLSTSIRKINLHKHEVYKKANSFMHELIFIEEGEVIIKLFEKEYTFTKNMIFGYLGLFFDCYHDIEIISVGKAKLKVINYLDLQRNGLSLLNFDISLFSTMDTIIHFVDICSDWRIFKIGDIISTENIIYLNNGSLERYNDRSYIVKRLSDVMFLRDDLIEHLLKYDTKSYKNIINLPEIKNNNKIVTIIPNKIDPENKIINLFSKRLKASIGKECLLLNKKDLIISFDISEELRISEFLNTMTKIYSVVLINIENGYSRISKFLHEISDTVLIVGYKWDDKDIVISNMKSIESNKYLYSNNLPERNGINTFYNTKLSNIEYVKLYETNKDVKFHGKGGKFHHVLSPSKTILFSTKDYDRLSRYLLNTRIGLVLSGGGARGIAHVGIIQALEEANIPIDIVGGTSMGAFVGALYCKECDNSFVYKETKKFSKKANSIINVIMDMTYPLISLFRGEALSSSLKKVFKDTLIQDLWIDFFCISTNLFTNEEEIHTTGPVWKYLRASMGLCGYVPPVCDPKGFLVDGGYLNNVPADTMLKMNVSKIIAVDVGTVEDNDYDEHEDNFNGFIGLVHRFFEVRKYITMHEIQYRIAFITSEQKLKDMKQNEKIFILQPDLTDISTMHFNKFDKIVASGYAYGKMIINKWKEDGTYDLHFNQRRTKNLRRRYSV